MLRSEVQKMDSCPMKGFIAKNYDEILGLSQQGLTTILVAPVGYRSAEDGNQHYKKVRKFLNALFENL